MFAKQAGAQYLTHFDLSDAYLQIEIEECSRMLLTVNIYRWLFQYYRVPPGIKSAPKAFNGSMVAGIPGVKPLLRR